MSGQDAGGHAPYAYERVCNDIRTLINAGTYGSGALLPSVREITGRWSVSSTTARRALGQLVTEGYARTEGRRGFISTGGPSPATSGDIVPASPPGGTAGSSNSRTSGRFVVRSLHSFTIDDLASLAQGQVSAVDVRREVPPADVTLALRTDPTTPVIVRRRLFVDIDDGMPIHFRTSYLPAEVADGTALADRAVLDPPWPLAVAIYTTHHLNASATQTTARHPTDIEAAALDLRADSAVLVRDDITYDLDGNPVDFTRNVWPGDTTQLTGRYPISS